MIRDWIVIKFGGTSVSNLENWRNIVEIIKQHRSSGSRILIVCSAPSQISNKLERLIAEALQGKQEILVDIKDTYQKLGEQLQISNYNDSIKEQMEQLEHHAAGIRLLGEASPRTRAKIMAFGELALTLLGEVYLRQANFSVRWQDARELLCTEEGEDGQVTRHSSMQYLAAQCATEFDSKLLERLNAMESDIIITQGFIASNRDGETVLLGRGGSDVSAAYFAAKIKAKQCEIWTDVPGVYSADPRQIPEARILKQLDYDEAQEIASMGGKVLHPNCISPLKQAGVPLYVKYTLQPQREGTLITLETNSASHQIKSIINKYGVLLISIESIRMWRQVGFLSKIFDCFKSHGLSIDLVSTSESNVTVSLDVGPDLKDPKIIETLLKDLNTFAQAKMIGDCASISLIGRNIRTILPKLGSVFSVFEQQKVHLLSQAANDLNLTFVVDENQAERLAQKLHTLLIEENTNRGHFGESWQQEFGQYIESEDTAWWQSRQKELLELMKNKNKSLFIYEQNCLDEAVKNLQSCDAIDQIYFAMKSNNNPQILQRFYQAGLRFECVSIEEVNYILNLFPDIERERILFTPNFAPKYEYEQAFALKIWVTIDNLYPLIHWPEIFSGREVIIRIDPGQGFGHHKYVRTGGVDSKFGIPLTELQQLLDVVAQHSIKVIGLHAHAGSGILRAMTWQENARLLADLLSYFKDVKIINVGGGLGVVEKAGQRPLDLQELNHSLAQVKSAFPNVELWMEPGRYLVARAGILLSKVTQIKNKNDAIFIGIETGMNSLIRPALYGSYHEIVNLTRINDEKKQMTQIVGPICESGDILGYSRLMPDTQEGDVMLIANTGAYSRVMSSYYNLREPAEEYYLV